MRKILFLGFISLFIFSPFTAIKAEKSFSVNSLRVVRNRFCGTCYQVSWETTHKATTEIEVISKGSGDSSSAPRIYKSRELTREHKVLILGVPFADAGSANHIIEVTATSVSGYGEKDADKIDFQPDFNKPENFPEVKINVYKPEKAYNGWTLFDMQPIADNDGTVINNTSGSMIVDMEGNVVWYSLNGGNDVEMLENKNLLFMGGINLDEKNLSWRYQWEMHLPMPDGGAEEIAHHDVDFVPADDDPIGHVIFLRETYMNIEYEGSDYILRGDYIEERKISNGQLVWSWNLFDHEEVLPKQNINPSDFPKNCNHYASICHDVSHFNAVHLDKKNGYVFANARNLNAIYKIKYAPGRPGDGKVIWSFGDGPDFPDSIITPPKINLLSGEWPDASHDPEYWYEKQGNRNVLHVLMFDNNLSFQDEMGLLEPEDAPPSFVIDQGGSIPGFNDDFLEEFEVLSPQNYLDNTDYSGDFASLLDNQPATGIINLGWRNSSRAVEYEIDEGAKTAEEVWEYDGSEDYNFFSSCWGDADRLPNGNTLITAGHSMTEVDKWNQFMRGILIEVAPDGEKVWELEMSGKTGMYLGGTGMYKAQRIKPFWQPNEYLSLLTEVNSGAQIKFLDMPGNTAGGNNINDNTDSPIIYDEIIDFSEEIYLSTNGDFDGDQEDETAFILGLGQSATETQKLVIYESDQINNNLLKPLLIQDLGDITERNLLLKNVTAGNFDDDPEDELAFLLENRGSGEATIIFCDLVLEDSAITALSITRVEAVDSEAFAVQRLAAGDFNADNQDELAVLIRMNGLMKKLKIYNVASGNYSLDSGSILFDHLLPRAEITHLAAGDYEGDGQDELFFVRRNGNNSVLSINEVLFDSGVMQEVVSKYDLGRQNIISLDILRRF